MSELKSGKSKSCASCSGRRKMRRAFAENPRKWRDHLKRAAAIRAKTNVSDYTPAEKQAVTLMVGAKQRCTNPNNLGYVDYGGRGIEFRFASAQEAGLWIIKNLGPRPSTEHSIDRIDNGRHYEPGNLRWATRTEQARNKRAYFGKTFGYRLVRLCALRPDYSYEGLRRFVVLGWSDEQIIAHQKGSHMKRRGQK